MARGIRMSLEAVTGRHEHSSASHKVMGFLIVGFGERGPLGIGWQGYNHLTKERITVENLLASFGRQQPNICDAKIILLHLPRQTNWSTVATTWILRKKLPLKS
jgi:hypothetical protein